MIRVAKVILFRSIAFNPSVLLSTDTAASRAVMKAAGDAPAEGFSNSGDEMLLFLRHSIVKTIAAVLSDLHTRWYLPVATSHCYF
jgi:hypothetical protein